MGTLKKEQRSTNDQFSSTMGTMEGAHRATGIVPMVGACANSVNSAPDPEVPEKKPRRKFTAKYKLRILAEADACPSRDKLALCYAVKACIPRI
jgi:hypothetical protein